MMDKDLIDQYELQVEVEYKGENYLVRNNVAVCRKPKPGQRKRRLDDFWTFGRPDNSTGYMNIGNHVVHRVVAAAFHGERPSEKHIVDHIDTNRRNNRAENLRWVTRLENLLLNPITLRRILTIYGSLDEFFNNPRAAGERELDFSWMRTVTKEEAQESRRRLLDWAESGQIPQGGRLGAWIYASKRQNKLSFELPPSREPKMAMGAMHDLSTTGLTQTGVLDAEYFRAGLDRESLTSMAIQRRWKTPCEFPYCPSSISSDPLGEYASNLKPGMVFARNAYGDSLVVSIGRCDELLAVMSRQPDKSVKGWALAKVTVENGKFIHEAMRTFFSELGAHKEYCRLINVDIPPGETIDDYC